jgi:hypothetical protein
MKNMTFFEEALTSFLPPFGSIVLVCVLKNRPSLLPTNYVIYNIEQNSMGNSLKSEFNIQHLGIFVDQDDNQKLQIIYAGPVNPRDGVALYSFNMPHNSS